MTWPPAGLPPLPTRAAEPPSTERLSLVLTAIAGFSILVVGGIALYFTWQNQWGFQGAPPIAPPMAVSTPTPTPTPLSYVHAEGFSITPPPGWKKQTATDESAPDPDPKVTFVNPVADQGDISFPATFTVFAVPAPGLTLEAAVASSREELSRAFAGFIRIDDAPIRTVSGEPAHILGGSLQGGLRIKELVVVKNDTLYIVTGTALASAWEPKHYNALFDAALTSLTIAGSRSSPSVPPGAR